MTSQTLGERMKGYESPTFLPPKSYTILRLDGRAFHTYTKDLEKPFDELFMLHMDIISETLLKEVPGAEYAYTQSDEISVLITDFANPNTEQWFGGNIQKIVSVSAGLASATLSRLRPAESLAIFDARIFTVPNRYEVKEYFQWRFDDCTKNAISATAQTYFSHKELQGLNSHQMERKLSEEKNIHFGELPQGFISGRFSYRRKELQDIEYTHKQTGEVNKAQAYRTVYETRPASYLVDFVHDNSPRKP